MRLRSDQAFKFDPFFPIYNWIYPATVFHADDRLGVRDAVAGLSGIRSRALYFHIPFCQTICTFCPFVRGTGYSAETIDRYVDALVREVELFAPLIADVPIAAIFFGGGTPSLLTPAQIARIGTAIHAHFDLSRLREFSFEFEIKSADPETIAAARAIGVTHARFGLQTFSERYRTLFNLTPGVEDIVRVAADLRTTFPFVSSDMIFGMHGQTADELLDDLAAWLKLGLSNLDYYPINNVSIQQKLADDFRERALDPATGVTKFYFNQLARAWLAEHGFMPHNGHGYVRDEPATAHGPAAITRAYSFRYHEHVYGYDDHDLFGFGVNAISSTRGLRIQNGSSLKTYIARLGDGEREAAVSRHDPGLDAARPIALKLPYAGFVERNRVDWDSLPRDTAERLDEVLEAGLAQESGGEIVLSREGWNHYSSMMYYLSPASERRALQGIVARAARQRGRDIGDLRAPAIRREAVPEITVA